MDIIFLGTGTGLPSVSRGSPSILVKSKEIYMLLDIGPGTLRQLAKAGIPFWRPELIFITHFHPDHINDLSHLLFALRSPAISPNEKVITIAGPEGLLGFHNGLKAIYGRWVDLSNPESRFLELRPKEVFQYKSIETLAIRTPHTHNSLALKIRSEGKTVVYSGDTPYFEGLIEFAYDSDLLILEASFPEPNEGHLTPYEAGLIAQKAKVRILALTHFYPEVLSSEISATVRKVFSGQLVLATDMMRLTLT